MLIVLLLVGMTNQGGDPMIEVNCNIGIAVTMLMLSAAPLLPCETMGLRFIST